MQHAPDIDAVLHQQRPVEAELLAQLRRGASASMPRSPAMRLDRVARHQPDQQEGEQRHAEEGRDDQADAGQDETQQDASTKQPVMRLRGDSNLQATVATVAAEIAPGQTSGQRRGKASRTCSAPVQNLRKNARDRSSRIVAAMDRSPP